MGEYSGNLYGTPKQSVEDLLEKGRSVILRIELQGARQIKERRPDAEMVFVRAPSLEETRRRLESRATESSESVENRMATAIKEVAARDEFDYEVVNGAREQARKDMIETLKRIVAKEMRVHDLKIDELLDKVDSRYGLVVASAKRARQINEYTATLGLNDALGIPGPQVHTRSQHPLSIAIEELRDGKLEVGFGSGPSRGGGDDFLEQRPRPLTGSEASEDGDERAEDEGRGLGRACGPLQILILHRVGPGPGALAAPGISREIAGAGHEVEVILEPHARRFVGPAAFPGEVRLVGEPSEAPEAVLFAPASAGTVSRLARGLGEESPEPASSSSPPTSTPLPPGIQP